MRGIAIISKRGSDMATCALIQSRTFDQLLRKARHVGYQGDAVVVEVWKMGDRPSRRVYVEYQRKYDTGEGKEKLRETCRVVGVRKDEMPKIEKWSGKGEQQ